MSDLTKQIEELEKKASEKCTCTEEEKSSQFLWCKSCAARKGVEDATYIMSCYTWALKED